VVKNELIREVININFSRTTGGPIIDEPINTVWGPKISYYPPIPKSLCDLFHDFKSTNVIRLSKENHINFLNTNISEYCPYHISYGHSIKNCPEFKDLIYDLNDDDRID